VIRFNCPLCSKGFRATDDKAGRVVVCPRCKEQCVVPEGGDPLAGLDEYVHATRQPSGPKDDSRELYSGMSRGILFAAFLAAGVALVCLLLPLLSPSASSDGAGRALVSWAPILAPGAVLLFLVILYGQATACPRCRKWWVRTNVGSEFLDREVVDRGGVPCSRSLYRTTYQCNACGHRWSFKQAEEYRQPIRQP
jgi:hypothetical protein